MPWKSYASGTPDKRTNRVRPQIPDRNPHRSLWPSFCTSSPFPPNGLYSIGSGVLSQCHPQDGQSLQEIGGFVQITVFISTAPHLGHVSTITFRCPQSLHHHVHGLVCKWSATLWTIADSKCRIRRNTFHATICIWRTSIALSNKRCCFSKCVHKQLCGICVLV